MNEPQSRQPFFGFWDAVMHIVSGSPIFPIGFSTVTSQAGKAAALAVCCQLPAEPATQMVKSFPR